MKYGRVYCTAPIFFAKDWWTFSPGHLGRKITSMRPFQELGISQQSVSHIEQSETIEEDLLQRVSKAPGKFFHLVIVVQVLAVAQYIITFRFLNTHRNGHTCHFVNLNTAKDIDL